MQNIIIVIAMQRSGWSVCGLVMVQLAYSMSWGHPTPHFSNCTSDRPVYVLLVGSLPCLFPVCIVSTTGAAGLKEHSMTDLAIPGVPKLCHECRPS